LTLLELEIAEFIGLIGGLLTTSGFIPQVIRVYRLKSAREISFIFTILFVSGVSFWLLYGVLFALPSVVFWNAITLIMGILLLYAKLKYGR
jgi:MtN3 and saliva related transmembrane protein